jgi:hypothetical protein
MDERLVTLLHHIDVELLGDQSIAHHDFHEPEEVVPYLVSRDLVGGKNDRVTF